MIFCFEVVRSLGARLARRHAGGKRKVLTDGHRDGQTEGQLDGWSVGRLDARRSARAEERKGGWLVGRALGHKEAGSGGQTDRRMDKQVGIMCTGSRTSLKKQAATDL